MSILNDSKNLGLYHNVMFKVIDPISGNTVSKHIGHNNATNSMITGIGHYLKGDGVFNQGYEMLSDYVPRYISLGTMGLFNQESDSNGAPSGIGNCTYKGKRYSDLTSVELGVIGKSSSPDFISDEDDEYLRFADYMFTRPGFGADGYSQHLNNNRKHYGLGPVFANRETLEVINCELISDSFPRSEITFRDIVPENEAEVPKTIDVIFSAMISTGALAQFRETDKDYIFITEAGLWSTRQWNDSGDNGLLAAYRIAPSDSSKWDMSNADNRNHLKNSIIKVKRNQIVQVVWKIQLGSIDQFGGVDKLYPAKLTKYWEHH